MEGTMTDQQANDSWFAPWQYRQEARICQLRAVPSSSPGQIDTQGKFLSDFLDFGRLALYFAQSGGLAPRVCAHCDRNDFDLRGPRIDSIQVSAWTRLRLDIAGGNFIDLRILDVAFDSMNQAIPLLEDLYYEELRQEPTEWDWMRDAAVGQDVSAADPYHQIVLLPSDFESPDWDTLQRLIYRANLDANREFSAIGFPDELNRRPGRGAAVGPFVSVLWGQQGYIESAVTLSACVVVSATTAMMRTQRATYNAMKLLHEQGREQVQYISAKSRGAFRNVLVWTQESISDLEAELTFGADAYATLLPIMPSLRVESYHQMLYSAADLPRQVQLVDRMLGRLRSSTEAQLGALSSVETAISELRIRRWSFSAQALATIAVPLSILLAYFGIGSSDIDPESSIFDFERYWMVYLAMALLVAATLSSYTFMRLFDRMKTPLSNTSDTSRGTTSG